jgi:hypothetical protein
MGRVIPEILLVIAAVVSSLVAYATMRRWLGVSTESLRTALWRTIECVGVILLFLAGNVLIEIVLVLLARQISGRFISLYFASDPLVVAIACVQGLVACWWRYYSGK